MSPAAMQHSIAVCLQQRLWLHSSVRLIFKCHCEKGRVLHSSDDSGPSYEEACKAHLADSVNFIPCSVSSISLPAEVFALSPARCPHT